MRVVSGVGLATFFGQRKRKRLEKYGGGKNAHLGPYKDAIRGKKDDILEFTKKPWAAWFLGFIFFITGLILLFSVAFGDYSKILPGFSQGFWWQYLICSFTIVVGISFLVAGTTEIVQFDKHDFEVVVMNKSLCCIESSKRRVLSSINSIEIVKRGRRSVGDDTIHYLIVLHCEGEVPLEMLETRDRFKIKQRYLDIQYFLGKEVELDNLNIVDQSDKAQKNKRKTPEVPEDSALPDNRV